jgi:hypothetical protein
VVRRVDRSTEQVPQALERYGYREDPEDLGGSGDVVGTEFAAAEQDLDADRAEEDQAGGSPGR